MTATDPARYAAYWSPEPTHPLWTAGCAWLGRDPRDGGPGAGPARRHVAAPWRYGFHATLKAPVRLVRGATEADWLAAVRAVAARHAPFAMPALRIATLDDFLALRPVREPAASDPLRRLADDCVSILDALRAPSDDAERARRLVPRLDARGRANVERWGYPRVFDDWVAHLTLTDGLGDLDPAIAERLRREAGAHFEAALACPVGVDAIAVFVEPEPGAPFELRARVALGSER